MADTSVDDQTEADVDAEEAEATPRRRRWSGKKIIMFRMT